MKAFVHIGLTLCHFLSYQKLAKHTRLRSHMAWVTVLADVSERTTSKLAMIKHSFFLGYPKKKPK